jgi:hypothetical protein
MLLKNQFRQMKALGALFDNTADDISRLPRVGKQTIAYMVDQKWIEMRADPPDQPPRLRLTATGRDVWLAKAHPGLTDIRPSPHRSSTSGRLGEPAARQSAENPVGKLAADIELLHNVQLRLQSLHSVVELARLLYRLRLLEQRRDKHLTGCSFEKSDVSLVSPQEHEGR